MDVTTATPVEIDTALAALWQERYAEQAKRDSQWSSVVFHVTEVMRRLGQKTDYTKASATQVREFLSEHAEISENEEMQNEAYGQPWVATEARKAWEAYGRYLDHDAAADEALMAMEPLDEEYVRRGRWNRAFLVTNGNGHVHRSMNCSSCYPTTQFHWVTEFSAKTEEEIVEAAGERACTVCYPSAPVEALSRPTQMFTPDEQEKQKAREEREQKRQERAAATVPVHLWSRKQVGGGHKRQPDGTTTWSPLEYADVLKEVTYKTVRAASNDLGALVRNHTGDWAMINGFETPQDAEHRLENIKRLVAALEERGADASAVVVRNHKRAVKDGHQAWDGVL